MTKKQCLELLVELLSLELSLISLEVWEREESVQGKKLEMLKGTL